jgi:hypothetical protein
MDGEEDNEVKHPPLIMSGKYSEDVKHLRDRLSKLESSLREKTDRYLHHGECMELVIGHRRYETTKVE